MDRVFIKPRKGLRVKDPVTMEPLPETGKKVSADLIYWKRRIKAGDVELCKPEPKTIFKTSKTVTDERAN